MIVDLTISRDHGLCDRLRAVTYFMAVARLSGDALLELHEPPSKHCPYRMCDSIEFDGLELRPFEGTPPAGSRSLTPHASPALDSAQKHLPAGLDVTAVDFLHHWIDSYTLIQPKPAVRALLDALPVSRRTLGVHVRRTDKVREWPSRYELSPQESARGDQAMEQHVRRKVSSGAIDSVFIASDSAEGRHDWMERLSTLGVPVFVHDAAFHPDRLRQTDATDFFVDLFALSRCGAIVGNVCSGVGFSARYIGRIAHFDTITEPESLVFPRLLERIGRRLRRLVVRG
ncbi:MAG: hypothetical protein V4550_02200 [Gemmatimonadota bacterium]